MDLNDLLRRKGIDPHEVLVFRHRPFEPELNKVLPLLAADRPDLFNAYQRTHRPKVEKAMTKARFIASFVARGAGKALFVGLYEIGKTKPLTHAQYWRVPAHVELKKLGMRGFLGESRPSCLWFDLKLTDFYSDWKGKLIVARAVLVASRPSQHDARARRPRGQRPRRGDEEVARAGLGTWNQLSILPKRWQTKLAEWRGIYYIFDASDGKGYVGSAYGADNLLGRWRNYAASGHGGNRLLRERDPQHFHFTILELVSPTMDGDEVIRRENTWKERLHTRKPNGLSDN